MITDKNSSDSSKLTLQKHYDTLRQLRHQLVCDYRPVLQQGSGPIRVMARMVTELERRARELHIVEEVIQAEIVNRTIGDINLRLVTECEGEPGGPGDYRMLAEDLGIALPGENINGYVASGETYLWLREQMQECERLLLAQGVDPRVYDLLGIGNPLLREWLAEEMQHWGIKVSHTQLFLGLGAMDSINKVLCGLSQMYRDHNLVEATILFPEPGFPVPEWQTKTYGYRLHYIQTREEDHFKMTAAQLDQALSSDPSIRLIYLVITNNPTAFAYTADELNAIHEVLRRHREQGRDVLVLADMAYIGTGRPEEDQARMATFTPEHVLRHTIFISSFSKTLSLTGERCGWVTIGSPDLATNLIPGWSNTSASLPAEWQLRFMAYVRLLRSRPWLMEKLRTFYRLRRQRFIAQLHRINEQQPLFAEIYLDDDATVYNWSKMLPGEDTFSVFEKTGIAGIPGSGFGYTDEYVRFSIGVIPVPES